MSGTWAITGRFVGLDLGQTTDPTALAVVDQLLLPEPIDGALYGYQVRHLQRYPLGTSYTAIARNVAELVKRPQLVGCTLVVDHTGVGRAEVDVLRELGMNVTLRPLTFTSGNQVTLGDDGELHVPKKDLVGCIRVLLQSNRLQVASALPEAHTLAKELQNFQMKITLAANEVFGAWREGKHDDLVFGVAMPCWVGEKFGGPAVPTSGTRTGAATAPAGVFQESDVRQPADPKKRRKETGHSGSGIDRYGNW